MLLEIHCFRETTSNIHTLCILLRNFWTSTETLFTVECSIRSPLLYLFWHKWQQNILRLVPKCSWFIHSLCIISVALHLTLSANDQQLMWIMCRDLSRYVTEEKHLLATKVICCCPNSIRRAFFFSVSCISSDLSSTIHILFVILIRGEK